MSISDDIARLEALRREGLLSDDEFRSAQQRLLAGAEAFEEVEVARPDSSTSSVGGSPVLGGDPPSAARRIPPWAILVAAAAAIAAVFLMTRESESDRAAAEVAAIVASFDAEVESCVLSVFAWFDTFGRNAELVGSTLGYQTSEYQFVYFTSSEARVIQFQRGIEAAVAEVQPKVIDFCISNPESRARFVRIRPPGY